VRVHSFFMDGSDGDALYYGAVRPLVPIVPIVSNGIDGVGTETLSSLDLTWVSECGKLGFTFTQHVSDAETFTESR
jgi:hypothetical protein